MKNDLEDEIIINVTDNNKKSENLFLNETENKYEKKNIDEK